MSIQIIQAIIVGLFALTGILITYFLTGKRTHEEQVVKEQHAAVISLFRSKANMSTEFGPALGEVEAVFAKNKNVLRAIDTFMELKFSGKEVSTEHSNMLLQEIFAHAIVASNMCDVEGVKSRCWRHFVSATK